MTKDLYQELQRLNEEIDLLNKMLDKFQERRREIENILINQTEC